MDPAQLQPGHRLDRYELLCPLAYGGMASVWLARFGGRRGFERLVVVKMILPQYASDPRFQEMFVDEARIASRIEHGNVARILDVGEHDENTTYIVMEWVDGDSLSKVVRAAEQKKQRVPAGIALRICADAAAGLHAAHVLKERDGTPLCVVHRDVSPQNILISNSGSTVIIDFGVAKARDRVSQDTSAGQLKGKIRYMAPEQALGRNIDHRADVWALGSILYELFTGDSPFDGPNEVATLHKLTSGHPPPPLPPSIAAPIRAVVARALAYDAEDRYATALELNLALESAMIEIGEPTSTVVVAHYTAQLLADRKLARKRAVDTALAAAHQRDADRAVTSSNAPPAQPSSREMPAVDPASTTARFLAPPVSTSELPSSPSAGSASGSPNGSLAPMAHGSGSYGPHGSMGYSEVPSATSNATLGSAAMEYPPALVDEFARRRRFVTAGVLGISVVAGLIGTVLIISTAIMRHDATVSGASAPAEVSEPPAAAGTANAAELPPPSEAATPAPPPVATAAPSALAAPAAQAPAAHVTTTAPTAAPTNTAPAATGWHRPSAPVGPAPRPKPTPLVTPPGKPDRGF
jgi:serine/threonine protein kinase